MNHQHHLKSDPKFGRFGRFSRGGGARGGARVMRRIMRMAMMVVGHGRKAFGGSCGQILGLLFPVFRVLATPGY